MTTPPPLLHMAYECPGLHDAGSRMHIAPRKFAALFEPGAPQIVIPLFQRTYCWSDVETLRWLNDARGVRRKESHDIGGVHPTGKAIFVRRGEPLICIDGQQRSTSMQLLIAALRDAMADARCALGSLRMGEVAAIQRARVEASAMIDRLDGLLYRDVAAARSWATANADREWSFVSGEPPPFATTLLPSFVDRAPFFELVIVGLRGVAPRSACSAATQRSCMGRAKSTFDAGLEVAFERSEALAGKRGGDEAALLRALDAGDVSASSSRVAAVAVAESAGAAPAVARRIAWLAATSTKALARMSLMYVEALSPISVAQVFLWLQEKALFSAGSLVHNPHPGKSFRAADLVRNLVLYPSMHLPIAEQEARHQRLWLNPIERRLGGADHVDTCLSAYLAEAAPPPNGFASSMERAVGGALGSPALYARFVTHVEGREIVQGAFVDERGGVAIREATCDAVLADLRAFVDASLL